MSPRATLAWVSLLLGLALAAAIAAWAGVADSFAVLRKVGWGGGALYVGLCSAVLFVQGLGWWILLRSEGLPAGLGLVTAGMLAGHVGSYVTPSAYLGGEPVRAFILARALGVPMRRTFATVLLHKFQELSGFLVFLLIGTWVVVAEFRGAFPVWITAALVAFAAATTAFFFVFLYSFARRRVYLSRGLAWLARFGRQRERLTRWQAVAAEMEEQVHRALIERTGATLLAHALTASTLALVWLKPALLIALTGTRAPLDLAEISLFFVTTQVLMAFQPTPGGIGVTEGGFVGAYALIHVPPAEAMAYMAAVRLADAFLVGLGTLVLLRLGWRSILEGAMGKTAPGSSGFAPARNDKLASRNRPLVP